MIKSVFLSCITCLVITITFSQDSVSTNKERAWIEKKLTMLEEKYYTGEYEEVADMAEKYLQKLEKKNKGTNADKVRIYTLKALSYYALLQYTSLEEEIRNALQIISQSSSIAPQLQSQQYMYLANYHLETGFIAMAEVYYKKADSLARLGSSDLHKKELDLLKAKIISKQAFNEEALRLIDSQIEYRNNIASSKSVDSKDRIYTNNKTDFKARKERYAEITALKVYNLVHEEKFDEASEVIKNGKLWIQKNLGKKSRPFADIIASEAYMEMKRDNYFAAASLYQKAYFISPAKEYQYDKNLNLALATRYYYASDEVVRSKNYLRRLQMYSFQYLGRHERFHLNYQYADASRLYYQGLLYDALKKINSLYRIFDDIPQYHPQYIAIKQLELEIARKNNDIKTVMKIEKELADIKAVYVGKNTPEYHKSLLAIAIEEIQYGKRFTYAESIFKNSYDGYLKNILYKYSKENMEYAHAYAALYVKLDKYDSAKAKSKDVVDIAKKHYGPTSAEYVAALAYYSEYCILAGNYKEGLDTLARVMALKGEVKKGKKDVLQKTLLSLARLNKLIGEYDKSKSLTNEAYKLEYDNLYEANILDELERSEHLADLYLQNGEKEPLS
jgi:hypothetical protein